MFLRDHDIDTHQESISESNIYSNICPNNSSNIHSNICTDNSSNICPTFAPSLAPTFAPTFSPTYTPTFAPSFPPTFAPTLAPTSNPSGSPSINPSENPTTAPTDIPTAFPTDAPSKSPSNSPTMTPTGTYIPPDGNVIETTTSTVLVTNEKKTASTSKESNQLELIIMVVSGNILVCGIIIILIVILMRKYQRKQDKALTNQVNISSNCMDNNMVNGQNILNNVNMDIVAGAIIQRTVANAHNKNLEITPRWSESLSDKMYNDNYRRSTTQPGEKRENDDRVEMQNIQEEGMRMDDGDGYPLSETTTGVPDEEAFV